ncbi:hypothetical protein [Lewinella cohaerens]|uniref:hypothetical protein n=1 Tax=Lewinella cohaerens TaxID=70995 RepID=UPI0003623A5B|nr:hypothetical protein [Lewinella cohaerens]
MRSLIIFLTPLLLLSLLAGFQPQDKPIEISSDTSVAEVLDALGAAPAEHRVNMDVGDISAEIGRQLVHEGFVPYPDGDGKTRRQSKHFVCTSCHNTVKEDPDLRYADPEARLAYVAENNIPFLPGTTLYGVVNRKTYYNGDYEKKYGDLVRPARNDLRGAIALCATECAQGRELEDWEMESILAYLWTIDLKMGDLSLPAKSLSSIEAATMGKGDKKAAAALLNSYFMDHSPATFLVPPTDRVAGYGEEGDPMNGALVYEQSCLHCHSERRYSFFNLDESTYSFNFLEKHFPTYSRYSSYQVLRYGTSPSPGKRAYMPHYTQERMSNQQVEDLRAFVSKGMN